MNERKNRGDRSPQRRPAEGVRIIRADEAQAALDAGEAAGRRPDDELRFGDVPPAPSGPRPPHRFPLPGLGGSRRSGAAPAAGVGTGGDDERPRRTGPSSRRPGPDGDMGWSAGRGRSRRGGSRPRGVGDRRAGTAELVVPASDRRRDRAVRGRSGAWPVPAGVQPAGSGGVRIRATWPGGTSPARADLPETRPPEIAHRGAAPSVLAVRGALAPGSPRGRDHRDRRRNRFAALDRSADRGGAAHPPRRRPGRGRRRDDLEAWNALGARGTCAGATTATTGPTSTRSASWPATSRRKAPWTRPDRSTLTCTPSTRSSSG